MTDAGIKAGVDGVPLPPEGVSAWRRTRRRELLDARAALPSNEHARRSAEVGSQVLTAFDGGLLPALRGKMVGGYFPFRREIDILPLLAEVQRRGAEIALPVVMGRAQPLQFRRWVPGDSMVSGVYGIPYPAREDPVEPDLLLVALLGFDPACYRLGYGGGFYDRTLAAAATKPFTVGLGLEQGCLPTIYPQPFDVALDCTVTESRLFGRQTLP